MSESPSRCTGMADVAPWRTSHRKCDQDLSAAESLRRARRFLYPSRHAAGESRRNSRRETGSRYDKPHLAESELWSFVVSGIHRAPTAVPDLRQASRLILAKFRAAWLGALSTLIDQQTSQDAARRAATTTSRIR